MRNLIALPGLALALAISCALTACTSDVQPIFLFSFGGAS